MSEAGHSWDCFLAHAGTDKKIAEELYDLLAGDCKVFLDSRCLMLGDDWDRELALAQSNSLVSVVLVSSSTEQAYYQREEVAAAIDMARKNKNNHRVVPVYIDDGAQAIAPYGLRLKHGLFMREAGGLPGVAQQLLHLLKKIKGQETLVTSQKVALEKLATGTGKEKVDGMKEITKLFGSLATVLISILAVLVLLIVLCLTTELVKDNRMLAVTILASMFTFVLACLMITFMKSISLAHQVVQSGIDGD